MDNLTRRGELRTPLLSLKAAKRALTGVRPIDTFFYGVCMALALVSSCLTGLGDRGGSFDSSNECLCASSLMTSTELNTCLMVFELACQYRRGRPSCLKELSSIDITTTPAIINCASNLLTHLRFASKLMSLYLMLAALLTRNRS